MLMQKDFVRMEKLLLKTGSVWEILPGILGNKILLIEINSLQLHSKI